MAVAVGNRNASVEFVVKPKQDLYLEGTLRRLPRVQKDEAYPCQMQKTQTFSCLFRHYAKHNGLRKEDLIFTFVDELLPDQTPETVHLMPQDEIFVEHRNPEPVEMEVSVERNPYSEQFRVLLDSSNHSDITFLVGDSQTEIKAHKCILSARSEYFDAMFRIGGMSESQQESVIYKHDIMTFRRMLEFIYTDRVRDLEKCKGNEVLSLLMIANEFLIQPLRELCESAAAKVITTQNITKFLLFSQDYDGGSVLRAACAKFIQQNISVLKMDSSFRQEVEICPELGLMLYEASISANNEIGYGSYSQSQDGSVKMDNKRRRVTEANTDHVIDNIGGAANTIAHANAQVND